MAKNNVKSEILNRRRSLVNNNDADIIISKGSTDSLYESTDTGMYSNGSSSNSNRNNSSSKYTRSHSEDYSHKSSNDDRYNSNVEKITTSDIQNWSRKMKSVYTLRINDLCDEDRRIFTRLADVILRVYGTSEYQNVVNLVMREFKDIEKVFPGTVGAYFIGCFVDDDFGGDKQCSPLYSSSVRPYDSEKLPPCSQAVAILDNEGIVIQSKNGNDKEIIVHILNKQKGLTRSDIQALKNDGFTKVTFYIYGENEYRTRKDPIDIDSIVPIDQPKNLPVKNNNSSYLIWWALGIIVVLVVIILFVKFWKSRKGHSNHLGTKSQQPNVYSYSPKIPGLVEPSYK